MKAAARPGHKPRTDVTLSVTDPTRVFISYRRGDSEAAAAHLRHSLGQALGEDKIFRDLDSLQPGQDFVAAIGEAIRGATVCLVLIGQGWLSAKNARGAPRLKEPGDFVRTEVEAALKAGIPIVPVLVDGARMPSRKQLPPTIADLANRNALELPWSAGIERLSTRILKLEKEREAREAADLAERQRLDLSDGRGISKSSLSETASASFAVVARAMEISLARQGHEVWLSGTDIDRSIRALRKQPVDNSGFLAADLFYVIDFVGVLAHSASAPAKRSAPSKRPTGKAKAKTEGPEHRYVARSYPLKSIADLPVQLALGRPVIAGLMAQDSWFEPPLMKSGNIDFDPKAKLRGGVMGALVGWDPELQLAKVITPWPTWGKSGLGTMTRAALDHYVSSSELRAVEPTLMPPSPFAPDTVK